MILGIKYCRIVGAYSVQPESRVVVLVRQFGPGSGLLGHRAIAFHQGEQLVPSISRIGLLMCPHQLVGSLSVT